ncbi:MAG: ribonuclease HIII [Ignavibacteriales bacterium]|nr:MAG: ribonuclease HIII [Ignavibacteriales bacterium]
MFQLGFIKGDTVFDRWDIIEAVGFGGFGEVYKAFDRTFERPVALKFIPTEKFPLEHRGFKVLLDVNHPNVVRVFDIMPFNEHYNFIISEFIDGETLDKIIQRRRVDLFEAIQVMKFILEGLYEIEKVAWHRDIKPQNIIWVNGKPESIKILDLGLARIKSYPLTHDMSIGGTEGYTPPEVWMGRGDESWDVFMTGITFYQLLTSELPYGIGRFSRINISEAEENASKKLISCPQKPPYFLCDFILKAIRLDKQNRFSSVNEFYDKFKKVYSKFGKHKDAIQFHDSKLRKFYDEFERKLDKENIEIETCKDIQYGIQFELCEDFISCKFNIYSGKDGIKITPIPTKDENTEEFLQKVLTIAYSILKIDPNTLIKKQVVVEQGDNTFSNIGQINELLKNKWGLIEESGFLFKRTKDLEYGTQYSISYKNYNFTLNVYYSEKKGLSIVFGGKVDDEIKELLNNILSDVQKLEKDLVIVPFTKWVGSDESGKGDYFGPLVAAAFLIDKEIEKELIKIGVKDSKILTDTKIIDITKILFADFKERIAICELPPLKYNEFFEKMKAQGKGLNTVLAWCHARVIQDLAEQFDFEAAIADQFGDESYIRLEIAGNPKMKEARKIELIQQPKAEKNIAVATASILARDRFARRIREYSDKYGIIIPKGAGPDANKVAKMLLSKLGKDELSSIVKLHFKNTKEIFED